MILKLFGINMEITSCKYNPEPIHSKIAKRSECSVYCHIFSSIPITCTRPATAWQNTDRSQTLLGCLQEAMKLYMGFRCCCPVPNHIIRCMCLCSPEPVHCPHANEICPAMHLLVTPHALQVSYCTMVIFSMWRQCMDPKPIPLKVKDCCERCGMILFLLRAHKSQKMTMFRGH